MFVKINTMEAKYILINVPHEGSDKSLPAIASMLENNAVFIKDGYGCTQLVEPEMTIELKDSLKLITGSYSEEQQIIFKPKDSDQLLDGFVVATPEVLVSNKATIEKLRNESIKYQEEVNFLRKKVKQLECDIEKLEEEKNNEY